MAALLCCTGMRIEEVLGLRWEDIDTERGCIHIRRAVVHPGRNMPEIKSRANHPASASPSRRTQPKRRNRVPPEQLHGPVKRNPVELHRSRQIIQTYPKTMRCRRVYRPRLPGHLCNRVARIRHFYRFDCPSPRTQKTDVTEQRYVKYRPELFSQIKDKMDVYGINNGTNTQR